MRRRLKPLRRPPHWKPPWRLRPKHGEPRCFVEQAAQYAWTHALGLYIAAGVTVSIVLQYMWHPRP